MTNEVKSAFGSGDTGLVTVGNNLANFGKSIGKFAKAVSGAKLGNVTALKSAIDGIVKSATTLNGLDFSGLETFSTKLTSIGTSGIDKFVKAFNSAGPKVSSAVKNMMTIIFKVTKSYIPNFAKEGGNAMTKFVKGITDKKSTVQSAVTKNVSSAVVSVRKYYTNFYNAGKFLVDGFAAGISTNTYKARAKATAMANAAYLAAKAALKINSPSKVFRSLGLSVPEGFAMGIGKMANAVKAASVGMTDVALDSVKSSISRISNIISGDIDSQPTIRPVVDLSDVRSSASLVSGMFDMNPSIGVMSNARAISSMMNKNQNGTNNDIISAIKDLNKSLGNTSGDTYNINGVTYDDGSNITDAVATLVRYARIERRT